MKFSIKCVRTIVLCDFLHLPLPRRCICKSQFSILDSLPFVGTLTAPQGLQSEHTRIAAWPPPLVGDTPRHRMRLTGRVIYFRRLQKSIYVEQKPQTAGDHRKHYTQCGSRSAMIFPHRSPYSRQENSKDRMAIGQHSSLKLVPRRNRCRNSMSLSLRCQQQSGCRQE